MIFIGALKRGKNDSIEVEGGSAHNESAENYIEDALIRPVLKAG